MNLLIISTPYFHSLLGVLYIVFSDFGTAGAADFHRVAHAVGACGKRIGSGIGLGKIEYAVRASDVVPGCQEIAIPCQLNMGDDVVVGVGGLHVEPAGCGFTVDSQVGTAIRTAVPTGGDCGGTDGQKHSQEQHGGGDSPAHGVHLLSLVNRSAGFSPLYTSNV